MRRYLSWALGLLVGGYVIISPVVRVIQIDVTDASESGSEQTESATTAPRTERTHFMAEWKDAGELGDQPVLALEFSPDGKLVVTASADGVLRVMLPIFQAGAKRV